VFHDTDTLEQTWLQAKNCPLPLAWSGNMSHLLPAVAVSDLDVRLSYDRSRPWLRKMKDAYSFFVCLETLWKTSTWKTEKELVWTSSELCPMALNLISASRCYCCWCFFFFLLLFTAFWTWVRPFSHWGDVTAIRSRKKSSTGRTFSSWWRFSHQRDHDAITTRHELKCRRLFSWSNRSRVASVGERPYTSPRPCHRSGG
jgi:hypothetical protein